MSFIACFHDDYSCVRYNLTKQNRKHSVQLELNPRIYQKQVKWRGSRDTWLSRVLESFPLLNTEALHLHYLYYRHLHHHTLKERDISIAWNINILCRAAGVHNIQLSIPIYKYSDNSAFKTLFKQTGQEVLSFLPISE